MAGLGGGLQAPALVPRSLPGSWRVSASRVFRAAFPRSLSCSSSSSRCVPGAGISTSTRVESLRPTAWALGLGTPPPTPQLVLRPVPSCACRQGALEGEQQGPGDSRRSGGVKLVSVQEASQAPGGDVGGGSQKHPPALLTCSIRDLGASLPSRAREPALHHILFLLLKSTSYFQKGWTALRLERKRALP